MASRRSSAEGRVVHFVTTGGPGGGGAVARRRRRAEDVIENRDRTPICTDADGPPHVDVASVLGGTAGGYRADCPMAKLQFAQPAGKGIAPSADVQAAIPTLLVETSETNAEIQHVPS